MKVLLDANISWKLVNVFIPVFGECIHVDSINFPIPVKDEDIWNYLTTLNPYDFASSTQRLLFRCMQCIFGFIPGGIISLNR